MKTSCYAILFISLFISSIFPQNVNQIDFDRFTHYEIDDWVTYGPALSVTSIAIGNDYIYFGTSDGGILRYNMFDKRWEYPYTTSSGLSGNRIFEVVYNFESNQLYAKTNKGIDIFNFAFNYWEPGNINTMPAHQLPLQQEIDGSIDDGNYNFPEYYRPGLNELPDFFTDTDYVFRPPNEILDQYNRTFHITNEIVVDNFRNLWMGTDGLGVAEASLDDYFLNLYQKSISNIQPRDLYFDNNKIWIAGLNTGNGIGGINFWDYDADKWQYYEARFNFGIDNDNCYAINGNNRYIFYGSEEGLIRFDKKNNQWKTFTTVDGLESNKINHLYFSGKKLFIGTDEGFNWMNSDLDTIEESEDTTLDNVPVNKITALNNTIYMATHNGIYTYNPKNDKVAFKSTRSAALDLYISAINIQNDTLWVAGEYGIMNYDISRDIWHSYPGVQTAIRGDYHDIAFTRDNVWFGTDNGLLKYDKKRDFWYLYTVKDGLANNEVYNIIPDSEDLWLCTKNGITIFRWYRVGRFE